MTMKNTRQFLCFALLLASGLEAAEVTATPKLSMSNLSGVPTPLEEYGLSLKIGIVQVGGSTWLMDPISSVWRVVESGTLPFDFSRMHDSVADAFDDATGLTIADGGSVGGVATFVITGHVTPVDFRGLVPSASGTNEMDLVAWIGRDDALPRRVRLSGTLVAADPPTMVRTLELSSFDKPVTIEPPI